MNLAPIVNLDKCLIVITAKRPKSIKKFKSILSTRSNTITNSKTP